MSEPIARLKTFTASYRTGLSYADLSPEEQRLLKAGGVCAAILLWFAVALVEPWLLLALMLLAGACVWLLKRRRTAKPVRPDDAEDWSY